MIFSIKSDIIESAVKTEAKQKSSSLLGKRKTAGPGPSQTWPKLINTGKKEGNIFS